MTDREILELAAKAATLEPYRYDEIGETILHGFDEDGFGGAWWNPLDDDGQALRLAVKIGLTINTDTACAYAFWNCRRDMAQEFINFGNSGNNNDPMRATRRAIVRAAAEIGRNTA